jgi:hypothetical protein
MTVEIIFKDGTTREWDHGSRPGGSYDNSVRYEGAFVIVRDAWEKTTAFPVQDVKEVITVPRTRW